MEIHSFTQQILLSLHQKSNIALGTGDADGDKRDRVPDLTELMLVCIAGAGEACGG
jgi:hypothetical protein